MAGRARRDVRAGAKECMLWGRVRVDCSVYTSGVREWWTRSKVASSCEVWVHVHWFLGVYCTAPW